MLYLHCGWPRTGTTSLQTALSRNREQLAAAGIEYPIRWKTRPTDPSHRGLYDLLDAFGGSNAPFDEFKRFLQEHRDRDVLLSAEALTNRLLSANGRAALLGLVSAAQEVMPTRCVWTLRRDDEVLSSMYLLALKTGFDLPPPDEGVKAVRHPKGVFEARDPEDLFHGMKRISELLDHRVTYVKYDSTGAHNHELLGALGISNPLKASLLRDLESEPRLNVSLTHKRAVALMHLDVISARMGGKIDQATLGSALRNGAVRFTEDGPCELWDIDLKRELHERALAAARRQGFAPYLDFFGNSEITGPGSVEAGPDVLTEKDLEQLAMLEKRRR